MSGYFEQGVIEGGDGKGVLGTSTTSVSNHLLAFGERPDHGVFGGSGAVPMPQLPRYSVARVQDLGSWGARASCTTFFTPRRMRSLRFSLPGPDSEDGSGVVEQQTTIQSAISTWYRYHLFLV